MQQKKPLWLAISGSVLLLSAFTVLSSWGTKPPSAHFTGDPMITDTVPDQETRDRKIRDIDDAIKEMDKAKIQLDKTMQMDMANIQKEMAENMKQLDLEKIKLQVEESLKQVDMEKIQREVKQAMEDAQKNIKLAGEDMEKMKAELDKALSKVEMEKIRREMQEAKQIDYKKLQAEMDQARKEIQEKMPDMKKELEKAQLQLENSKKDLLETKAFIDGLGQDGLINKEDGYTIRHKEGVLYINGEKQPETVYNKYRSFLEKRKTFTIKKNEDGFTMDTGDWIRKI